MIFWRLGKTRLWGLEKHYRNRVKNLLKDIGASTESASLNMDSFPMKQTCVKWKRNETCVVRLFCFYLMAKAVRSVTSLQIGVLENV